VEPRISLITLGVRDLPRAVAFYRDGLGWPMSSVSGEEVAFFRTSGAVFALWLRNRLVEDAGLEADGSGFGGIALAYNARSMEEVDAVLEQAVAAGATMTKRATSTEWGGYNGYFTDPDGYLWEVAWNPGFPLGPDGALQIPE
jgi:catechol 2,3-dioxygenase-like lactoylglutathione lyase family enzyme